MRHTKTKSRMGVFNVNKPYRDKINVLRGKRCNMFMISKELNVPLYVIKRVKKE